MATNPPREGARWGADPRLPGPQQVPPYAELYEQYGEANVHHAQRIRDKILRDYPHLDLLKGDPAQVLADILDSALRSVRKAASQGRAHTMPETLDLFDEMLGNAIATGRSATLNFTINYGDEPPPKPFGIADALPAVALLAALTLFYGFITLLLPFRWSMIGGAGGNGQLIAAMIASGITAALLKRRGLRVSLPGLFAATRPYWWLIGAGVVLLAVTDMLRQTYDWPSGLITALFFVELGIGVWMFMRMRKG